MFMYYLDQCLTFDKGNLLRAQEGAMIVSEAEDILYDYRF